MGKTKTAFVGQEPEEKKVKEHKKTEKPEKVHIAGLKGGQRIKTIETEPVIGEEENKEGAEEKKKAKEPKIRSKKYQDVKKKIETGKQYPLSEAIKLVKETSYSKFDGTVELHLVVKKAGTQTNITLPHSAGKQKKIEVASEETIKKLQTGKIDFDVLLATAEMMPKLVPFARFLGPKGLMPNPKNGTLIKNEKEATKFSGNSMTLKTEKEAPLIHTAVGKVNQDIKELTENSEAVFKALGGEKQILKAFMKATMGPSVRIKLS
jgi:large subunit ribosomal protein L1